MMKLVVRKATAEDIPSIVKVRRTAFTKEEVRGFSTPEPSIYYSSQELRKAWDKENLLKDGWEVAVAEANRGIVGFIVFKIRGDCCEIDNINVAKDSQGNGVGKTLVMHVEETAKAAGCSMMQTDTTENAEGIPWKSYGFWTKMGYRDTGERLPTQWDFKTIPFKKNLGQPATAQRKPCHSTQITNNSQLLSEKTHNTSTCSPHKQTISKGAIVFSEHNRSKKTLKSHRTQHTSRSQSCQAKIINWKSQATTKRRKPST